MVEWKFEPKVLTQKSVLKNITPTIKITVGLDPGGSCLLHLISFPNHHLIQKGWVLRYVWVFISHLQVFITLTSVSWVLCGHFPKPCLIKRRSCSFYKDRWHGRLSHLWVYLQFRSDSNVPLPQYNGFLIYLLNLIHHLESSIQWNWIQMKEKVIFSLSLCIPLSNLSQPINSRPGRNLRSEYLDFSLDSVTHNSK